MTRVLAMGLTALLVSACGDDSLPAPGCESDADCAATCESDADCAAGEHCEPDRGCIADIRPGCTPGIETCNSRDDDCNGVIDDGTTCEIVTRCMSLHGATSAYLVCETPSTSWSMAHERCAEYGYHLVVVVDQAEQDLLTSTITPLADRDWWLGLRDVDDDGTYADGEWDGGSSSYRAWAAPPASGGQCVTLSGATWGVADCTEANPFICETP